MLAAWLCLLSALPAAFAAPADVEAPGPGIYAEASPDMLARRARSCRADLKDYRADASRELLDRLIVCMEHPDARLRAEVLDQLPDRKLWDRPDYEKNFRPALQQLEKRFEHDPDKEVRLHADQLAAWLANGERWRDWDSPQAPRRDSYQRNSDAQAEARETRKGWVQISLILLLLAAYARYRRRRHWR
jgi:hypothetical protein